MDFILTKVTTETKCALKIQHTAYDLIDEACLFKHAKAMCCTFSNT